MSDDLLVATTLRLPQSLKTEAEEAAADVDRSFSNFVCLAIAEKLARSQTVMPGGLMRAFSVTVQFSFPARQSGVSLARVTTAAMCNSARDVGAQNVEATLAAVLPPE